MRRTKTLATLALVACTAGAYAQSSTNATRNGSHVLQGDFRANPAALPTFTQNSGNSKRVGYGGAAATARNNEPIWGLDLPPIPAGETLTVATLSVDVLSISGSPLFFEVVASLMTNTVVSDFSAAPENFYVEDTAPLDSVLSNGIVFAQFAQSDVPVGGTLQIPVAGAALTHLNSLYDVDGFPLQSTVWFRLSTSVSNDPAAYQAGDRIQFADGDTSSEAAFGLNLSWAPTPAFSTDPVVKASVTWGTDYATLSQTLDGSATPSDGTSPIVYEKLGGPAWLVVATNGALSGIADNIGTNEFPIKAIIGDNIDTATLQIVVDPLGNPPVFATNLITKADETFGADYALQSQTLDGEATDLDGDTLTYSKISGPAWLNVASNGALSGVCDLLGTNTFTVGVDDGNGNSDTATLEIFVPLIGSPPEFTVDPIVKADGDFKADYALESQTLAGSATDPDGGILTYSKTGGPVWLNVASNGALSGVCDVLGTNSFTVTVEDENGNSDAATLLIYVAPPPPPPPNSLVHHWKFDEGSGATAVDSAGVYDGAISGAIWTNDGVRGTYLSFDGTNDRVDPSLFLPQWSATNAETWAVWVNAGAGNVNDIILGNRLDGTTETTVGTRLFAKMTTVDTSNGRFVYNDGTAYQMNLSDGGRTEPLPVGEWYHLAIVRDGADFTFYVNGTAYSSPSYTVPPGDMPTAAMPFFMGGEPGTSATEHFLGGLDDVVIYNYALTSNAVVDVMNGIYGEIVDPPVLSIAPSGGSVIAFWSESGFKLQTSPKLVPASWSDYPDGGTSPVNVPATNDAAFLRLIQQ